MPRGKKEKATNAVISSTNVSQKEALKNIADWKKYLTWGLRPTMENFPKLPEYTTLFRFVIATVYGLVLGSQGSFGGMGCLFGLSFITFTPLLYAEIFLQADSDSFKGQSNLTFVGVPNAFAWMLLIWIFFFTLNHEEEENIFNSNVIIDTISTVEDGEVPDEL